MRQPILRYLTPVWALVLAILSWPVLAEPVRVVDDTGVAIELPAPARRIVALAPHVVENLFAAGAGEAVIAAVEHSDHPLAAQRLPKVGGYSRLDLEAIVALRPDLVVAWASGNDPAALARLEQLGLTVYRSEPKSLEDIAAMLERFGALAGVPEKGHAAAHAFRVQVAALAARYGDRPPVRVFYQIWNQPLMTVGGGQILTEAMRVCAAQNVFADLPALAPRVSVEAVLAADPEVIVASGMGEERPDWLEDWRRWPQLTAVARGNLFFIPPVLLQRPTSRLLEGLERLCQALETARQRR